MKRAGVILGVVLGLGLGLAARVQAAESQAFASARDTVSLVSDSATVQAGHTLRLGLRFQLAPGWHIYWRNPGDAGQAPSLALHLPPGASAGGLGFPAPETLHEGPVTTYGYTGTVLLPVAVQPGPQAGADGLAVQADADWLVCEKICVPEQAHFSLALPPGPFSPAPEAALFDAAPLPAPSPFPARIAADGTLRVQGDGLNAARVAAAQFYPDQTGAILAGADQTLHVSEGAVSLALQPGPVFKPDRTLSGVLVLKDGGGQQSALQIAAQPGGAPESGASLSWSLGWLRWLGFALLGGLLLNLMPCVFPILAMKALALAGLSGAELRAVRGQALAYMAGVLASFTALGGGLIALRAFGGQAARNWGWGFQFQSPVFVAGMALVLFLVGLNLSGVYQLRLRAAGLGQSLAGRSGFAGSFFTGLLAVVVATPCTAPFMAGAIAAALTAPAPAALAIFLAMGLGLGAPSLVLAFRPHWAASLPRPGLWMEITRQALAFPIYGAVVWLGWVLAQQSGAAGVLALGCLLVLSGFAAWAWGVGQQADRPRLAALAILPVLAALPVLIPHLHAAPPAGQTADAFSEERLAALRAAGRPVLVDMTAAWCVSCLVNEQVALAPAHEALAQHHVALLRGDWTAQDPAITEYLHRFGREGVPLYVFYPVQGAPRVLPQILTPAIVRDAIGGS